jgi:hypothetical protein
MQVDFKENLFKNLNLHARKFPEIVSSQVFAVMLQSADTTGQHTGLQ